MKRISLACLLLAAVMLTAAMTPTLAQEKSAALPKVAADGAGARPGRSDNMHGTRFLEIFLAYPDAKTGKLVAECYNTMFTSKGIPASKDTAPQTLVERLDVAKMKTDYGVLGASLNGPKLWLPDWTEIDSGVERDFGGIKAAWVARLNMGDNAGGVAESTPYKPMTIARKSGLGWKKGTTVLLLDDAEGNTWIMKGFQLGLKPQHTYEQFVAAGASNFKKLPPGWKFRIKTLEKDLIEVPESGIATIMPDEFFNIYDKTGPGMTQLHSEIVGQRERVGATGLRAAVSLERPRRSRRAGGKAFPGRRRRPARTATRRQPTPIRRGRPRSTVAPRRWRRPS